jgi:hypothetical protein
MSPLSFAICIDKASRSNKRRRKWRETCHRSMLQSVSMKSVDATEEKKMAGNMSSLSFAVCIDGASRSNKRGTKWRVTCHRSVL